MGCRIPASWRGRLQDILCPQLMSVPMRRAMSVPMSRVMYYSASHLYRGCVDFYLCLPIASSAGSDGEAPSLLATLRFVAFLSHQQLQAHSVLRHCVLKLVHNQILRATSLKMQVFCCPQKIRGVEVRKDKQTVTELLSDLTLPLTEECLVRKEEGELGWSPTLPCLSPASLCIAVPHVLCLLTLCSHCAGVISWGHP